MSGPTEPYSVPFADAGAVRRVAVLGSTGSIGRTTLGVIDALPGHLSVAALCGHSNATLLIEQARRYRPAAIGVTCPHAAKTVRDELAGSDMDVIDSPDASARLAERQDVDLVLSAIVGAAGIPAAFAAVQARKPLALANKEALVVAGELLVPLAVREGVPILPVDSEHSAIAQAMRAGRHDEVRRVVLTASGGPFRDWPASRADTATVDQALDHPTWAMGLKISVDSATLFNKGLELIEAVRLFGVPEDRIDVTIHPQSVVHSMVEFVDGSTVAQLSPPDMGLPIQAALTWPRRLPVDRATLDWASATSLTFGPPNAVATEVIGLARGVARDGGTGGAVLNAANEVAVSAFLAGRLTFGGIRRVVAETLSRLPPRPAESTAVLWDADAEARRVADAAVRSR